MTTTMGCAPHLTLTMDGQVCNRCRLTTRVTYSRNWDVGSNLCAECYKFYHDIRHYGMACVS